MDYEKIILQKLDKIDEKQDAHSIQLALNTEVLSQHHKRTTLLEERVEPIEHQVVFLRKLLKSVSYIIVLLSGIAGIVSLFLNH